MRKEELGMPTEGRALVMKTAWDPAGRKCLCVVNGHGPEEH